MNKRAFMHDHTLSPKPLISVLSCLLLLITVVFPLKAYSQDLDEIKQRGVVRHLGIPYANFVTGSGDGMDVELVKLFAAQIGVRYEYVKTDWDDAIGDLTGTMVRPKGDGVEVVAMVPVKGDLIANGMTVIRWREQVVRYSAATFPNQVWLVARSDSPLKPIKPSGNLEKDIAAVKFLIRDKSILCKTNTCLDPSLYNLGATGAKVMLFKGALNELAPAVLNGEAEATLLDVPDALVALQKWPGKIKVIGPVSGVQDMAVAFRKDSPKLHEAFNQFLATTRKNGTLQRIALKYYPFVIDYYADFFKKR
jgi:ABC-type amino acid transport substrate-binding protein